MRKTKIAVVLASLVAFATSAVAQVDDYREIKTPTLRSFSMPQPKRIALTNGMVIFLQEDRELPLIRGTATVRGGSRDVAAAKAGLLSIYTQAWRTGGTAKQTGDQLDEFLEARAAEVETGGDQDSTSVSLDILKGDLDAVLPIWVDLLRNPAFRQEKIELAKTQLNTSISRRNDSPGDILNREISKLGYGPGSPYTHQAEYATIASITRDDLLAFHKQTVHPNNIILSFIGDFDSAQLEKRLRDTFGSWARGPQVAKPDPGITPAKPGVYFVQKEDVTQANIALVHPGIERNNPDFYAAAVMNEIFSGGFSGRLMQRLRSERGLTYGVGGGIGSNWDYPGLFRVSMATKSETTLEALEALRKEISSLTTDPVTAAELSLAKESILNAYVFTMDTRAKALNQRVLLEFYGFPEDYFVKYPSMIEKVTADDVSRTAKKYIHPDQLAVLVVGNATGFERPLTTLGTVTPIDITIPELGGSTAAATPSASNAEGTALANKVAQFVGGKTAIDAVKSLQRTAAMTMHTPQGAMEAEVTALVRYPDSQRTVMKLPMGEMTRVVTPAAAFMITPMGTQDLPGSQRDAGLSELRTDLLNTLQHIGDAGYVFSAAGTEKIGDVDARVLEVSAGGSPVKWYVNPATGQLLRSVTRGAAPMPGDVVTDFSDWKSYGAIQLPATAVITQNGQKAAELRLTAVEVNPAVAADTFTKPPAK
jgi:zinc protease